MAQEQKPAMKTSDEANRNQLQLARAQGDAYVQALNHMATQVADDSDEKRAGDFVVAYAVERAEGMYYRKNGRLEWREPQNENCHIEIAVRDASDNRFIPGLNVYVRLIDSQGDDIGLHRQPMLWHPWLLHYGRNWEVPEDGEYTLQVRIEAPDFPRHDRENGERFADDVEVTFENVTIKAG